MPNSGIYKISCLVTGKFYIGSAVKLSKRKNEHFNDLAAHRHCNKKLQSSYKKYGAKSLLFEVIEYCEKDKLIEREQHYLDTLLFAQEYINKDKNQFRDLGFNINPVAGSQLGSKRTAEQKKFMSEVHKGRFLSENHRNSIGNAHRGMKRSAETREAISRGSMGKKISEEAKKLMRANSYLRGKPGTMLGKKHSIVSREAMSKSKKGKKFSEEARLNMSTSRIGNTNSRKAIGYENNTTGEIGEAASMVKVGEIFKCHGSNIGYHIKANTLYKGFKFYYKN